MEFTPSRDGRSHGLQADHCRAMDSPVLPDLRDQIPDDEQIGAVTTDGAYDTRRCHTAIMERQATAIIPFRKNGDRGKWIVRQRWPETGSSAPHDTMAGRSGSGGRDTMPEPDRSKNALPQGFR